ncbi:MAG: protein translocase subunit SecD [Gemmatimonadales bacterium]
MTDLRYRLAIIAALIAASVWSIWPRAVVSRIETTSGVIQYDTARRIPIRRGLDLEGGMHLTLEVDESKGAVANKSDAIDRALKVVRTRIDQFGVSEPVVQRVGTDRMVVELPGVQDQQRAYDIVKEAAFLQMQIVDKSQALDKVLPKIDAILKTKGLGVTAAGATPGQPTANAGVQSLFSNTPADSGKHTGDSAKSHSVAPVTPRRGRHDSAGRKAGTDTTRDSTKGDSAKRDSGALANMTVGPFSQLIQQGQMPGEFYVAKADVPTITHYLSLPDVQGLLPPGKVIRWSNDTVSVGQRAYQTFYVLDSHPIITGEYLVDANPQTDPIEGTKVDFRLSREGGRKFQAETGRHINDYMAIVLDSVVMGRPPVIESAIGTNGQITMGGKDLQAAQDLALVLRAGALPVPLKVAEVRQIGPSLGQDSIVAGVRAGVIAVLLVVVIMLVYYRFSGLLAVGGLALYMLYTMAALASFDAVLTLPGLAGFILSIGIAVDANVLIFERIREELDRGKTPRTSIDEGFRHAMSAIIDSNVTTVLTAAVLYQYGTGPVKGFAVTLIAGILASMVTSIFVVRTFYMMWLTRARSPQTISI